MACMREDKPMQSSLIQVFVNPHTQIIATHPVANRIYILIINIRVLTLRKYSLVQSNCEKLIRKLNRFQRAWTWKRGNNIFAALAVPASKGISSYSNSLARISFKSLHPNSNIQRTLVIASCSQTALTNNDQFKWRPWYHFHLFLLKLISFRSWNIFKHIPTIPGVTLLGDSLEVYLGGASPPRSKSHLLLAVKQT